MIFSTCVLNWVLFSSVAIKNVYSAIENDQCNGNDPGSCAKSGSGAWAGKQPNVVILLADDMGYGDLASYGHPSQEYNEIDMMAMEGIKFQQFYAADSMCTPARAGLLTGRLPIRSGMVPSRPGATRVLNDFNTGGLPKSEWTMPEMFQRAGYFTGMAGKWHLGINRNNSKDGFHLPGEHGFEYVGWNLPMTHLWECDRSGFFRKEGPINTKCYIYHGSKLVEQPYSTEKMADRLDESWHEFLEKYKEMRQSDEEKKFFFFYSFPHVHASNWKNAKGDSSKRGLYGDHLNEMAYLVGQVMQSIKKDDILRKDTLVLFLSDHGPHRELCQSGSTAQLRSGKSSSYEGGYRIPAILWYHPDAESLGTSPKLPLISTAVISALDLMPTFATMLSAADSDGRPMVSKLKQLDGTDVSDYLLGHIVNDPKEDLTTKRPIFYYCSSKVMAVRYKQYKVHFFTSKLHEKDEYGNHCPHSTSLKDWYIFEFCKESGLIGHDPPIVYDLNTDPYEQHPLSTENQSEKSDSDSDSDSDTKVRLDIDIDLDKLIDTVQDLIDEHSESIETVPNQLDDVSAKVIPCCNYPKCECELGDSDY